MNAGMQNTVAAEEWALTRKRTALLVCLAVFVQGIMGCSEDLSSSGDHVASRPGQPQVDALAALPKDTPVMFAYRSSRKSGWLEIAVWKDGFVLFTPNSTEHEHPLQVGRIDPSVAKNALQELATVGFFGMPATIETSPDSSYVRICARYRGTRNSHGWDGIVRSKHRKFEEMWKRARRAVSTCMPSVGESVDQEAGDTRICRGYALDEPLWRTEWFDSRLWYAPENNE